MHQIVLIRPRQSDLRQIIFFMIFVIYLTLKWTWTFFIHLFLHISSYSKNCMQKTKEKRMKKESTISFQNVGSRIRSIHNLENSWENSRFEINIHAMSSLLENPFVINILHYILHLGITSKHLETHPLMLGACNPICPLIPNQTGAQLEWISSAESFLSESLSESQRPCQAPSFIYLTSFHLKGWFHLRNWPIALKFSENISLYLDLRLKPANHVRVTYQNEDTFPRLDRLDSPPVCFITRRPNGMQ